MKVRVIVYKDGQYECDINEVVNYNIDDTYSRLLDLLRSFEVSDDNSMIRIVKVKD